MIENNPLDMTVGDLRAAIKDLPDDGRVYYQRIEDVYFEKHGWRADKILPDPVDLWEDPWVGGEYINAFSGFGYDNDGNIYITAHY